MKILKEALTFDDVLIVPAKSNIKPAQADVSTFLTKKLNLIYLSFPLLWTL